MVTLVTCPTCGTQSAYTPSNPYRPFCCERCKLIDLGLWANEGYRIPENETPQIPEEDH